MGKGASVRSKRDSVRVSTGKDYGVFHSADSRGEGRLLGNFEEQNL
jgi:hypothetical protein